MRARANETLGNNINDTSPWIRSMGFVFDDQLMGNYKGAEVGKEFRLGL